MSTTGYRFDGYDGSDEGFERLLDEGLATMAIETIEAVTAPAPGVEHCTGCEAGTTEGLVPWAGERLCWNCADTQLDLLAKAIVDDMLVTVRAR